MNLWYPIECEHGFDCCPICDGERRDPLTLRIVGVDLARPGSERTAYAGIRNGKIERVLTTRPDGVRRR